MDMNLLSWDQGERTCVSGGEVVGGAQGGKWFGPLPSPPSAHLVFFFFPDQCTQERGSFDL